MPINELYSFAIAVPLVLVVTLCAMTDILERRIPNIVLAPALALALGIHSLMAGWPGFADCGLGLIVGMGILFPFYFAGGISAGDVKLLGVVGALLGTNGALIAGVSAVGFAGVLGILIIAWKFIEPVLSVHIAQFVRTNGPTVTSPVRSLTLEETRKVSFPYAPAIAFGSYYALWKLGYYSSVAVSIS